MPLALNEVSMERLTAKGQEVVGITRAMGFSRRFNIWS
jgi:hypothetical protein